MKLSITKKLAQSAKRLPAFISLLLFMLLCACTAYWAMQLIKPPVRPVTAILQADGVPVDITQAASLFGGRGAVAVVSNYQLLGIVAAKNDAESIAILSVDNKPAQAVRQGKELLPGITLKEVHATYVLLSEGGVVKRVVLPDDVRGKSLTGNAPLTATQEK